MSLDTITIIVAVALGILGLCVGFGKTLRFFTKGIFGIIISVFVCFTFGGMIKGIPAVAELISSLNEKLGNAWGFLQTIHLETVLFYVILFFVVLVRVLLVHFVCAIFEADVLPMRLINKLLGMVLMVAAVFLLTLLVLAVFRMVEDTSFVQGILEKIDGTFLGKLYESNPVKFVVETAK